MRFLSLGPFQDTTTVHINVEDVDEPPVFEPGFYFVEVPEDVAIGTTIQIISAKDPDVTNNSIRFSTDFTFFFYPGILPSLLPNFLALFPFASSISGRLSCFFKFFLFK